MKRSTYLMCSIFTFILAASAGNISAQSSDRDNPTPLNSSEVSGTFGDHQKDGNREIFYSFMAGPGELTITFDVKRRGRDDSAGFSFELLPSNGSSTAILCCEGAQSGEGGTGREVASVKLTKKQTVILHITNASNGGGSFDARLSGAGLSFGEQTTGNVNYGTRKNEASRGDRDGDPIAVPSSGTLHIRMKNGSTQDIDLNLVRNVSVRP
ncbi:MAG: hypothetical protein ABJA02_14990 [Acidobacteriota bacterium]